MGTTRSGGVIALVIASFLWGTTGTAAHLFPSNVSPIAIGSATMGVGGLLLFALSARASIATVKTPGALPWLLLGALGVFVYPLAFYSGMDLAGVAIGNVVALGSGPIFAAMFEWVWERHRPGAVWAGCTVVAVVGIVLLALGGEPRSGSSTPAGVLFGLLAGAAYALYTYVSSRVITGGSPSSGAIGAMFGIGGLLLLPVLLVTGVPLLQSPATLGLSAYLALGPMVIAYTLFGVGLRFIRSSSATTITLIEPLVATLLAVVVVGERLTAIGWIGLALILVGVVVIATARHPGKAV